MNEYKLRPTSYIVIPSFAREMLNLKGAELLIFSIIYNFSQDGRSGYSGGMSFLESWVGSRQTVVTALKQLQKKDLIFRVPLNQKRFIYYTKKGVNFQQSYLENYSKAMYEEDEKEIVTEKKENNVKKLDIISDEPPKNNVKNLDINVKKLDINVKKFDTYINNNKLNSIDRKAAPSSLKNEKPKDEVLLKFLEEKFQTADVYGSDEIETFSKILNKKTVSTDEKKEFLENLYSKVVAAKPNNFFSYFYKAFVQPGVLEQFLANRELKQKESAQDEKQLQNEKESELEELVECPACKNMTKKYSCCHYCELEWNERKNPEKIKFHKNLYEMPPERKISFVSERKKLETSSLTVDLKLKAYNELIHDFDLV